MSRRLRRCVGSIATAAAVAALASSTLAQESTLERDRARLLELHEEQRRAHLEKDPELLLSQFADDFVMIADGDVTRPTREESRRRFERYFGSVEFIEWDDVEPPIVRISADGTLAHVIVQKRVRLIASESGAEEATQFAWLATYEKRDGDWRLTAVASTERAMTPSGGASRSPATEEERGRRSSTGGT